MREAAELGLVLPDEARFARLRQRCRICRLLSRRGANVEAEQRSQLSEVSSMLPEALRHPRMKTGTPSVRERLSHAGCDEFADGAGA